jgi:hypothetical protein
MSEKRGARTQDPSSPRWRACQLCYSTGHIVITMLTVTFCTSWHWLGAITGINGGGNHPSRLQMWRRSKIHRTLHWQLSPARQICTSKVSKPSPQIIKDILFLQDSLSTSKKTHHPQILVLRSHHCVGMAASRRHKSALIPLAVCPQAPEQQSGIQWFQLEARRQTEIDLCCHDGGKQLSSVSGQYLAVASALSVLHVSTTTGTLSLCLILRVDDSNKKFKPPTYPQTTPALLSLHSISTQCPPFQRSLCVENERRWTSCTKAVSSNGAH